MRAESGALIQENIALRNDVEKLTKQRDELLASLKKLENAARASRGGLYIEKYDAILDNARDVIANVETSGEKP